MMKSHEVRHLVGVTGLSVAAFWACSGTPSAPGSSAGSTETGESATAGTEATTSGRAGTDESYGPVDGSGSGGGPSPTSAGGAQSTGGSTGSAGEGNAPNQNTSGGASNGSGGAASTTGGILDTGGSATGAVPSTGGAPSTGGTTATTGGTPSTGGAVAPTGGTSGTGGTLSASGGSPEAAGGQQDVRTPILHSSDADPTYAISGPWHGYIWPAVDSNGVATISPSASEAYQGKPGPPFCASGHVPATASSTAVAMIGMNTAQERAGGAVASPWAPTGEGILVNVSNPGGSPLRLQIQTHETGAIGEEWCAMITQFDQDIVVRWSDFYQHAQCANKVGDPFSGTMAGIATVMIMVPGTSQGDGYDFDFCVYEMTPV